MMPTIAPPSVLSAPQRRCQVLLTLFQPEPIATVEIFSALNGVDDDTAREDITETSTRSSAIIALPSQHARTVAIGSKVQHSISAFAFTLAQARPAFMPTFVTQQFTPALKTR